jgi:hypothetical protein
MKTHLSVDLVLLQFQATSLGYTHDGAFTDLNKVVAISTNAFGHEFLVGVDQEVGFLKFEDTFICWLDLEVTISSGGGLVFGEEG